MKTLSILIYLMINNSSFAGTEIKIGDKARVFKLKTMSNEDFYLADRKGKWTVLYFFPKAETPGCTKQACGFRDNIEKIRELNADVYGISTNSVREQADFAKNHNLNFTLLADDKAEVASYYGSKMPLVNYAKRWTYIIDPQLIIRDVTKDVDPILDAQRVIKKIKDLQLVKIK